MKPATKLIFPIFASMLLSACGGGGGSGVSSPGSVAPPVAPPPPPAPPAGIATSPEYRNSAAREIGAVDIWNRGFMGDGITIAFVDTGLDTSSGEFDNRISSASSDATGAGRDFRDDVGGHGTAMASIAAAGFGGKNLVGIAPRATVAMMRTDRDTSCATECRFLPEPIAEGMRRATQSGAKIINISLGGGEPGMSVRQAASSAANAGVLTVVAAGNDNDPEISPFAAAIADAAPRTTIVAGGTQNPNNPMFLLDGNAAGAHADRFLVALSTSYALGTGPVAGLDRYYGTSISAAVISGAAALLFQAFPNLGAADIAEILLTTARDVGAPGVDPVSGHGVMDLAAAFRPVGKTSIAATGAAVSTSFNGVIGSAFGSGFASGMGDIAIRDSFNRAYRLSIGDTLRARSPDRLAGTLQSERLVTAATEQVAGPFRLALTLRAAGDMVVRPAGEAWRAPSGLDAPLGLAQRGVDAHAGERNPLRETRVSLAAGGLALHAATGRLAAQTLPGSSGGGMIARDGLDGMADGPQGSRQLFAAELPLGRGRFAVASEYQRENAAPMPMIGARDARRSRISMAMEMPVSAFTVSALVASARDEGGFLGTQLSPGFGLRGGSGVEAGGSVDFATADFALRFALLGGHYVPDIATAALLGRAGGLDTLRWSVSATLPVASGALRLHLSQPPAIESGGFMVSDGERPRFVSAAATSPERTAEMNYAAGPVEFALFQRFNAGHVAGLQDAGLAVRFGTAF